MSCQFCDRSLFKEKLGRCKQCMQINAVLLLFALSLYWGGDISTWQAVQRVAFFMFLGTTSLLMAAHIIAWSWYQIKNNHSK